jgi:muconate cycloisomerase
MIRNSGGAVDAKAPARRFTRANVCRYHAAVPFPDSRMKIKRVEPIAVSLPMTKPMKMAGVEIRTADNLLVRLETDGGHVGWGEAGSAPAMTGETAVGMLEAARYVVPAVEGLAAADIARVSAVMKRALYGNYAAKSAIEMALHDALGRAAGKPVYELLGGKRRERVPVLWLVGTGDAAADVEEARNKKAAGFVAYKIKVGVDEPLRDAERTRRICDALGAGNLISADANQGWSVEQAIAYVQAVADTRLDFFEQPVMGDDLPGMARVAAASRVPIGFDEGAHGIADIERHHAMKAASGISLKTIKLGGLRPVMEAGALCERLGMKVNLACKIAESGIATAGVLQLAAALPSVDWGVSLSSQYLADDVVRTPIPIALGHATVPQGPGLGIDVDEAKVRRYRLKC